MLDHLSEAPPPPSGSANAARDALTETLLGLRLDGVEYGRCQLQTPWAVAFPAQRDARFHFVGHGQSWLHTHSTGWLRLNPGDAVLLPRGSPHVVASSREVPAVDIDSLARVAAADNIYLVDALPANPKAAVTEVMFCGALRFNLDPLHPLLAMMPEVLQASELARRDPNVPALLDLMEREVSLDRIGSSGMLARLADVLAASIIRAWVESSCGDTKGWIAALRCPKVGKVIAAIHADPERAWSVPMLADVMGASRSSFTEAFTRTVGESPARYVAKLKMVQARQWIGHEGMRVSVAASRLGYDSEASFSRAFKRVLGHSPIAARHGTRKTGAALARPTPA